jgi:hypothetical protein
MNLEQRSLEDIFHSHRGKVSDKWSSYLPIYDRSFERFRRSPVRLLEIGIQNGGSLEVYQAYFLQGSLLVGCDIDAKCQALQYDGNVHVAVGDCCATSTRDAVAAISPRYDIIIDDGSHRSSDIIRAFLMYFPMLEQGGIFIIEDLHASYWHDWEGGLFYTLSSMAFLKLLADIINCEHWGNGKTVVDLMQNEFADYAQLFPAADLDSVYSVHFFNSVCIVEKAQASRPVGLGPRAVTGVDASVVPRVARNGSSPITSYESHNPYSILV